MDALLARIYEHPDDLATRLVYADALSERGDPRGEFIQLQLLDHRTPLQAARMKGLLESHRSRWLAPLGAVLQPDSVRFSGGFAVSGCFRRRASSRSTRQLVGHPAWATFRQLDIRGAMYGGSEVVTDPSLRCLEHLVGLPAQRLPSWVDGLERPLRYLGVQVLKELKPVRALKQASLPHLRVLELHSVQVKPHQLAFLWDGGPTLNRLILHSLRALPAWVAAMPGVTADLVELRGHRWRLLIHRPEGSRAPAVEAHFDPDQPVPDRSPMLLLARVLRPIGGIIGHLSVTAPASFTPPSSYVRRVLGAIEAPATLPEHWWLRL